MNGHPDPAELFPLHRLWRDSLEELADGLRRLVRYRDLTGTDLLKTARLIVALERLPHAPQVELINASLETNFLSSRQALTIVLSQDRLELSRIGIPADPDYDAEVETVLDVDRCEIDEWTDEDAIDLMPALAEWVNQWASWVTDPDCRFEISDEEVFDDETDDAWDMMPPR
ncbi:MAG TPA: hypothetical protein PLI18_08195 [Pirellulaceae bacterium]|nr:hypothetical protein [Pirellulaceae bacterium]